MALPIARDKHGTRFTLDPATNQWRPLSDDERGNIAPAGVLDEMGVTNGERFIVKNLPPEVALTFLRAKGYEAVQYGDGHNFATRRGEEPWKLVDPAKGGIVEVWKDLTDLLGDLGVAGATALGTAAGGGFASIATGAASGAAAEIARQNLARAAGGLPPGVSGPEVAGAAIGGGIAPPLGRAVGGAVRGVVRGVQRATRAGGPVGRAGEVIAQKVGDIKLVPGIEMSDVLIDRARTLPQPIFTPDKAIKIVREHMDQVAKGSIDQQMRNLERALPQGLTVSLRPFVRELRSIIGVLKPSGELTGLAPAKAKLQEQVLSVLQRPGKSSVAAAVREANPNATRTQIDKAFAGVLKTWERRLDRVPARAVLRIKRVIQSEVAERKGFQAVGVAQPGAAKVAADEETKELGKFAGRLTAYWHTKIPKAAVQADKDAAILIRARNSMRNFFGAKPPGVPDPAIDNLRNALKPGKSAVREAIQAYDKAFQGATFSRLFRKAATEGQVLPRTAAGRGAFEELTRQIGEAQAFTPIAGDAAEFGLPSPIAKFTATGQPIGVAAIGGLPGFAFGGPMGALLGAAVSTTAAPFLLSPAMITRLAPRLTALNASVTRMAAGVDKVLATKLLRESTAVLATQAAQATGRRVASQDAKGRRRAVFIGQ